MLKEDVRVCVCDTLSGKRNLKRKEFERIMENKCPYGLVNGMRGSKGISSLCAVLEQHTTTCIVCVFPSRNGH